VKVNFDDTTGVLRGGVRLEQDFPGLSCPNMNTCETQEYQGIKGTVCCCQNKDLCNTAAAAKVNLAALLLGVISIYFFALMH
jgi:hypothetical protein